MPTSSSTPDYKGQRVKVAWPSDDEKTPDGGVYGDKAAWIEFDKEGNVAHSRKATDEEVRWWLLMRALESIRVAVIDVETAVQRVPTNYRS